MFRTRRQRHRPCATYGTLPPRPQRHDYSYDAAMLAFLHLQEQIDRMPESAQSPAWQRVMRTLSTLPNPDLAEALSLD